MNEQRIAVENAAKMAMDDSVLIDKSKQLRKRIEAERRRDFYNRIFELA